MKLNIYTSILKYKAEEFVCLLERANLKNFGFDLKNWFVFDGPFMEEGFGLYNITLQSIEEKNW